MEKIFQSLFLVIQKKRQIRKVRPETRNCWWDPRLETRDPSKGSDLGPETRDPKGGTRDPEHLFYEAPKIRDPGH